MLEYKSIRLYWLGHAAFRLEDRKSGYQVYFDPYNLPDGLPIADVVLITHSHFDHLSMDDLKKIISDKTILIASEDCVDRLNPLPAAAIVSAKPDSTIELPGLRVQAVPSYNLTSQYHPKNSGFVGYVVTTQDGISVYHAGDTDAIPEMSRLEADIALLPVSGKYTMDARAAAEATKMLDAKIAVPMHYGEIIGSEADAREFQEKASCAVRILEKC